jgi:opacity protein-like surface antigen
MNIKSLLLGSAAALAAVSGAQAADAIVAAEPEPMEYVRVCDAFGTGYFYIPGTETCLKVGGRVRFDAKYADAYSTKSSGTYTNTRAELYMSTASDTEFGALKTNMTARFDYNPRNASISGYEENTRTRLMVATIELGGFTVGLQDSLYEQLLGYAGNVINDDVVNYGPSEVAQIAYTYKADAFTAFIALEDDGRNKRDPSASIIDSANSDAPNVAGGVKFDNGTFMAGVTAGYDESMEEGAIKARIQGKFGAFSAFLMGGWNTDGDTNNSYAPGTNFGGDTGTIGWGDWALWGGAGYKFSSKLATNVQLTYTDSDIFAAAANLQWTPVSGFLIQPEVSYTSIQTGSLDKDQWAGVVRVQRTF